MSRSFVILASLALAWGAMPISVGARPVYAAQLQAVPDAPTMLVAFAADRDPIKIGLRWDDNSANETKFEIERRLNDEDVDFEKIGETSANQTQFVDGNIRNNIQYEYRVRAVNADGPSDYSNPVVAFFGTPGKIRVQPTKIDFGTVKAGATRTRKFTVRNTGRTDISVTISLAEGTPFAISDGGGVVQIKAGDSQSVSVQYHPTANGKDHADVSVLFGDVELKVKVKGKAGNGHRGGGGF